MAYGNVLTALADPRRRDLLENLRDGPACVSDLAASQPISRPAVSQHLKVLIAANLVDAEQQGNRRMYTVRREGLAELRHWLDGFWDDAFLAFGAEVARQVEDEDG